MDEIVAQFVADGTSLALGEDIFIDETASEERNVILVKTMLTSSSFVGIKVFDVSIIICDTNYDTARSRAETISSLFVAKQGISGSSWGTIGNVESRYEGTDTMKRTVYSVTCKIGKQED